MALQGERPHPDRSSCYASRSAKTLSDEAGYACRGVRNISQAFGTSTARDKHSHKQVNGIGIPAIQLVHAFPMPFISVFGDLTLATV
jgi:transketolase C-terminal domain/subunit